MIGPGGPVDRSPEMVELMFDSIRRSADSSAVRPGTTIEWAFTDNDPWHLVIDNGSTRAVAGAAPHADLTLRVTLEDWVDIVAERADPRRLLLSRRLKPRGDLRLLLKLGRIFN